MRSLPRFTKIGRGEQPIRHAAVSPDCPSIPVRLDVQQWKRAEDIGQVGWRCRVQIGFVEFGEFCNAKQSQGADHFVYVPKRVVRQEVEADAE